MGPTRILDVALPQQPGQEGTNRAVLWRIDGREPPVAPYARSCVGDESRR